MTTAAQPTAEAEPEGAASVAETVAAALMLYALLALPVAVGALGVAAGGPEGWRGVALLVGSIVAALVARNLVAGEVVLLDMWWVHAWFAPVARFVWRWNRCVDDDGNWVFLPIGVVGAIGLACAEWVQARSFLGTVGGGSVVLGWVVFATAAYIVLLADAQIGRALAALARREPWEPALPRAATVVAVVAFAAAAWLLRPLGHGLVMVFVQYPLVTWIPLALGAVVAAPALLGRQRFLRLRRPVTIFAWALFMLLLPGWQGRALDEATAYRRLAALPQASQLRLLPKEAAQVYGGGIHLHLVHLAVDPSSGALEWTGELKHNGLPVGASSGIGVEPLDRVDGTLGRTGARFDPAVTDWGPGSLLWRAYRLHYFTRVQDPVIVPLADGRAIAIAPYLGYRGFPVRHPYWRGVYVFHQDGRLEDLTPRQAIARPELALSGRPFPERLARDTAEAYGYRTGAGAAFLGRARTVVSVESGNPQPYLTNLGGGHVAWVTMAHANRGPDAVAAIFLTDAVTGVTDVWRPPPGRRLLSNRGALRLVKALPIAWDRCCDDNGDDIRLRYATEPRPMFARGRLYYLVSVMPDRAHLDTPQPVDRTVVVDAAERRIVRSYNEADTGTDARLQAYFR